MRGIAAWGAWLLRQVLWNIVRGCEMSRDIDQLILDTSNLHSYINTYNLKHIVQEGCVANPPV